MAHGHCSLELNLPLKNDNIKINKYIVFNRHILTLKNELQCVYSVKKERKKFKRAKAMDSFTGLH